MEYARKGAPAASGLRAMQKRGMRRWEVECRSQNEGHWPRIRSVEGATTFGDNLNSPSQNPESTSKEGGVL